MVTTDRYTIPTPESLPHATPWFCKTCGGKPIADAPDTSSRKGEAQAGYCAIFPERHEDGTPKTHLEHGQFASFQKDDVGAETITLCREHYREEWEERYPDEPFPDLDGIPNLCVPCQHENPGGSKFCNRCGGGLE